MPDLLDPADPRGGSRQVIARGPSAVVHGQRSSAQARHADRPLLLFDRVSKWYGPVLGVNQVTLELRPGITGLVGTNGAGKSTLLRLAAGQLQPDLGEVRVLGLHAWSASAKRFVGYCPDVDAFYEEMSGRQFVLTMARLLGLTRSDARRRTEAVLEQVGLLKEADRRLRGYSKGMRQRIKLAQALLHDPKVLILDEPLNGIDPIGRQESLALFNELARQGKSLLVSSHELEELEKLTDHVAVMTCGRIAAVGTLAQIRDLLDNHPLSILIRCDRPRQLASDLLALDDVAGLDLAEGDALVVKARNPRRFFKEFTGLVLEEDYEVRHLETLDDSAQAILGYLLGGAAPVSH